jgi:two-component system response regulator HydG
LADRFLHDLSREYGRAPKSFAPEALAVLRRHDWPGNVRALRNVVERALLLAPGDVIRPSDFPAELGGAAIAAEDLYAPFPSLQAGIAAFTQYFVRRALREENGDIEAAARRLGISSGELRSRVG